MWQFIIHSSIHSFSRSFVRSFAPSFIHIHWSDHSSQYIKKCWWILRLWSSVDISFPLSMDPSSCSGKKLKAALLSANYILWFYIYVLSLLFFSMLVRDLWMQNSLCGNYYLCMSREVWQRQNKNNMRIGTRRRTKEWNEISSMNQTVHAIFTRPSVSLLHLSINVFTLPTCAVHGWLLKRFCISF